MTKCHVKACNKDQWQPVSQIRKEAEMDSKTDPHPHLWTINFVSALGVVVRKHILLQ